MKPEIKELWVTALRSGEYQQTAGRLQDDTGYCCLGVLCDLHAKSVSQNWHRGADGEYYYLSYAATLPLEVTMWAGITDNAGYFGDEIMVDGAEYDSLVQLNDDGIPFSIIASLIEAHDLI